MMATEKALQRLGYAEIASIRNQAIEIYIQESKLTKSLGFTPFYIPENGPENEEHWERFLKMFSIQQQLGWGEIINSKVDLKDDTSAAILDLLTGLRVRHLPESKPQRELLANIIFGAFTEKVKDSMIARILQWNTPSVFFVREENVTASFDLLKQTVESLGQRAQFTENGIIIVGDSERVYTISPSNRRPYYKIRIDGGEPPLCLQVHARNGEPFGDHLTALVLGLYNDQVTAERIPALERVLNTPSQNQAQFCGNCDREMTTNVNTSNPALAPQSTVNPNHCRTCHAGNSLPKAAQELGYSQADRDINPSSESQGDSEE